MKKTMVPSVPYSFLTRSLHPLRQEVVARTWFRGLTEAQLPPPAQLLLPPSPSPRRGSSSLLPAPPGASPPPSATLRRRGSRVRVWGVPAAARLLAVAQLILTPPRSSPGSRPQWLGQRMACGGLRPNPSPRLAPVVARLGASAAAPSPAPQGRGRTI